MSQLSTSHRRPANGTVGLDGPKPPSFQLQLLVVPDERDRHCSRCRVVARKTTAPDGRLHRVIPSMPLASPQLGASDRLLPMFPVGGRPLAYHCRLSLPHAFLLGLFKNNFFSFTSPTVRVLSEDKWWQQPVQPGADSFPICTRHFGMSRSVNPTYSLPIPISLGIGRFPSCIKFPPYILIHRGPFSTSVGPKFTWFFHPIISSSGPVSFQPATTFPHASSLVRLHLCLHALIPVIPNLPCA